MKRNIKVRQHDSYDCGAASLCSIAAWHGKNVSLARARRLCGCTKEGITIKGIIDGASGLGLNATAYKSEDKNIESIKIRNSLPAIAHLKKENGFFHFVTLCNIEENHIEIMDPAYGEFEKISYESFSSEWTGFIIFLYPGENFKKGNEQRDIYKTLFSLLRYTKKEFIHAAAGSLAIIAAGIMTPMFLQRLIDNILPQGSTKDLFAVSLAIAILTLLMLYISYGKNIYMAYHGMRIDNSLILKYINRVFALPYDCFNQYSAGDFNSRISDAFNIRLFISEGMISAFISVITLCGAVAFMLSANITLAIMSICFIPLYIGLYFLSEKINKKYNRELAVAGAKLETEMLQGLEGIVSIRHYGAEKISIDRIENIYRNLANKIYDASKAVTILGVAADSLSKGLIAATLAAGGYLILGNRLSIGELMAFYALCSLFTSPLNALTKMNALITQSEISAERLFEIIDIENEEETAIIRKNIPQKWEKIIISDLNFSYPGRGSLLDKLNLRIESGTITAITGESGCGKSTLAALLMRDFMPVKGSIFIDKTDIRTIPIWHWREFITIIPQKIHMFNATLLENITCGQCNRNSYNNSTNNNGYNRDNSCNNDNNSNGNRENNRNNGCNNDNSNNGNRENNRNNGYNNDNSSNGNRDNNSYNNCNNNRRNSNSNNGNSCNNDNNYNSDVEHVIAICAELGLYDFIHSLPSGLLTNIGENGSALSGGEMQKLAIARAVYKNPQIFIFDEATVSIDKEAESFIMRYITKLKSRGKTIIMITHDKEILKYADHIITI